MFGDPPSGTTAIPVSFREHPEEKIDVFFQDTTLLFEKTVLPKQNSADTKFSVSLSLGIIDPKNKKYFDWPNQGVIGLAPTTQPDETLRQRQFLWQVSQ